MDMRLINSSRTSLYFLAIIIALCILDKTFAKEGEDSWRLSSKDSNPQLEKQEDLKPQFDLKDSSSSRNNVALEPEELPHEKRACEVGPCPDAELKSVESNRRLHLFELLKISHKSDRSCDRESFRQFDKLVRKYSTSSDRSILDYILSQRLELWQTCKRAFLDCQEPNRGTYESDEAEMAFIVRYLLSMLGNNFKELWSSPCLKLIETSVRHFVEYKLNKKSHKKAKIKRLFESTLIPACNSVHGRFHGIDGIAEIIVDHQDLRDDLDTRSINWLTALAACNRILQNSEIFQSNIQSIENFWHKEDSFLLYAKYFLRI